MINNDVASKKKPRSFGFLKKLSAALGLAIFIAIAIVISNTLDSKKLRRDVFSFDEVVHSYPVVDGDVLATHMSEMIRFPTISHYDAEKTDSAAFDGLLAYLETTYPITYSELAVERVGCHALLFTWQGSDRTLLPALLASHMDVVPIAPGTWSMWTHEPFGGQIEDDYIWGRGSIDDKSGVLAVMEATELLLSHGFRPRRSLVLAFGHDEETQGLKGAGEIVSLLASRGVRLEMVLDEGGLVADGMLSVVPGKIALVGVAEKGYSSVLLSVEATGGHSSMPGKDNSAVPVLSRALARLDEQPLPTHMGDGVTSEMLQRLLPRMNLLHRMAFSNKWLFGPLLAREFAKLPSANALIRTTAAQTILSAGEKDNVLPKHAAAVVNFRLLPGDTPEAVMKHVRQTVADPRVRVSEYRDSLYPPPVETEEVAGGWSTFPSPISPSDNFAFAAIEHAVRAALRQGEGEGGQADDDEIPVAPYLVVGATDARYYYALTDNVYRFLPITLGPSDLPRIHGVDERVATSDLVAAVRFYVALIETLQVDAAAAAQRAASEL